MEKTNEKVMNCTIEPCKEAKEIINGIINSIYKDSKKSTNAELLEQYNGLVMPYVKECSGAEPELDRKIEELGVLLNSGKIGRK